MKFLPIALLLALLVVPSIAFAEWVHIGRKKIKDGLHHDIYYDSEFKIDGNFLYVWHLASYVEETWSTTMRNEYDCGTMRFRAVTVYGWDAPMGTGTPTKLKTLGMKWERPSPGSPGHKLIRTFCAKAGF